VKLTVVAKDEPPVKVLLQLPEVDTVAVALALGVAANEIAGDPLQLTSLSSVVTGPVVVEGLVAVPVADTGTITLPRVTCASVSPPDPPVAVE
jgi:hypothetical protein